ncbi:hypothetical protein Pmani_020358 [Petrolisthes manimaculis]|uniref:Uncharacterized protein n=1 Tax=Petrolisthes manimaculis TaxID=1843537 RepID=A0AAE1U6G4_9EUCA|nr:hypothetical protein Pmani_020358 [Petrolisthes manimaculis]
MRRPWLLTVVVVVWAALIHAHDAHQGKYVKARTLPLLKAPLRMFKSQEQVVIDGQETTIGLAAAYDLAGVVDESWDVFGKIVKVLIPSTTEEDIDYFGVIEDNVRHVVGEYIDQHNLDQLEVYKDSLGVLLQRYTEAPIQSDTYPDKNTVANSLSTSIVSNRFLVEAGQYPQSMIIHFADIASIHILVLKDVANTYSGLGSVSRWWQDLDTQLDHYIEHGRVLRSDVVDWRNDMIRMNRDVSSYVWNYLGKAMREWEALKIIAAQMAKRT